MQGTEHPPAVGATMADWLALHGVSAGDCAAVLALALPVGPLPKKARAGPPSDLVPSGLVPDAVWRDVAAALAARLPVAGPQIARTRAGCRTNFAPDIMRFPRAFTLQDAALPPYVSCPCTGGIGDLLVIAHEFGHALQLIASAGRPVPPVARETCACLCEHWYLAHLQAARPMLHAPLAALWRAKSGRAMGPGIARLHLALADPAARYSYQWNYPMARILAHHFAQTADRAAIWRLFTAEISLRDLIQQMLAGLR